MDAARAELREVPMRIDLEKDDKLCHLRDWYLRGTIEHGADSVSRLMGVTYLSQFEDLSGEFAERPVFTPDFRVGYIPYSTDLLRILNSAIRRGQVELHATEKELRHSVSRSELERNGWDFENCPNMESFMSGGAQLARLYEANKDNLKRLPGHKLFRAVEQCYQRDGNLRDILGYVR